LSAYGKKLLVSAVLAIVIVLGLAFSALLAPSLISPTQTPEVTPIPTPHPIPPPAFFIKADIDSAKGFNYTTMESQGFISKILVLPPGGSGTIPVTLVSEEDKDYAATLYIEPEGLGEARMYRGIQFTFSPTSMLLKAGGTESSILKVEVDPNAPTGFYGGSVGMRFDDRGALSGGEAYFNLLILPYTPDYAFYIYAEPQEPAPLPTPTPYAGSPAPYRHASNAHNSSAANYRC